MIRETRRSHWLVHAALIAAVGGASLGLNADFTDPPRYDGAGYAVLAQSLIEGRGYREIDKPDAPRHAHFPPGYPLVLAALWEFTGISAISAHALSFGCTLVAMLLSWAMFRLWFGPKAALLMGLALAVNWRWGRDGTAIQSEPLFLLLAQSAVLVAAWISRRGGLWRGALLGLLLGSASLTRHVAIALAAVVVIDLFRRRRRREAVIGFAIAGLVISPWVAWLAMVRSGTQVGLVPTGGVASTISENSLFYLRRLIDQIVGPVIEVATVFRPRFRAWATSAAIVAAVPIVWGWVRLIHDEARRLAGLIPASTLALLLAWPFTEAGRFLLPLIPFLIAGSVEGLGDGIARLRGSKSPILAASLILVVSLPYSIYAIASGRSEAARRTNRDFDATCGWMARQPRPGPVLTRHPGEVFWATGRTALSPESLDVARLIARHRIVFLLIDDERFAKAARSPLGQFAAENPGRVERVFASDGPHPVFVYSVRAP